MLVAGVAPIRRMPAMQRVRTESGSVYDVDRRAMRIRRVHGKHGPADTQPQDGIWRRVAGIEGPTIGETMVVYWAKEAAGAQQTDFGFRTTTVVEVHELEPVEGAPQRSDPTGAPVADAGREDAGAVASGPDRAHQGA